MSSKKIYELSRDLDFALEPKREMLQSHGLPWRIVDCGVPEPDAWVTHWERGEQSSELTYLSAGRSVEAFHDWYSAVTVRTRQRVDLESMPSSVCWTTTTPRIELAGVGDDDAPWSQEFDVWPALDLAEALLREAALVLGVDPVRLADNILAGRIERNAEGALVPPA